MIKGLLSTVLVSLIATPIAAQALAPVVTIKSVKQSGNMMPAKTPRKPTTIAVVEYYACGDFNSMPAAFQLQFSEKGGKQILLVAIDPNLVDCAGMDETRTVTIVTKEIQRLNTTVWVEKANKDHNAYTLVKRKVTQRFSH